MGIASAVSSYFLYNDDNSNVENEIKKITLKSNKNNNFNKILNNSLGDEQNVFLDKNTGIEFTERDYGNKTYQVGSSYIRLTNVDKNYPPLLFLKFKRKKTDNLMTMEELQTYIGIKNGQVFFKKMVNADTLYRITKTLNDDFYLAVDQNDRVIPFSKWQANQVILNRCFFHPNKKLHISKITKDGKQEVYPQDFKSIVHCWFGQNVRHKHPYAYSDMVINKQVKNYTFTKKSTNGTELRIHTQFSNELTDKFLTLNNPEDLKEFVNKMARARSNAMKQYQEGGKKYFKEYIFAMPFPLYDRKHMLSIVVAIRPNGDVNITIINANNRKTAEAEYAEPIAMILNNAFEKYAPNSLAKNAKYFFQENKSQYGPTCMTHADCITRQIVKDENLDKDCRDIHPIKILEKAYLRGFATTLYQKALKQGKFMADDIEKLQAYNSKQMCKEYAKNEMKKNKLSYGRPLSNEAPNTNTMTYFTAMRDRKNRNNLIFKRKYKRLHNKNYINKKQAMSMLARYY